jgi:hypothetical protein
MTMRACRIGFCPHPAVSRSRCAVHAKPDEQQRHRFGISVYNDRRWRGKHGLRNQVLRAQPLCVLGLERAVGVYLSPIALIKMVINRLYRPTYGWNLGSSNGGGQGTRGAAKHNYACSPLRCCAHPRPQRTRSPRSGRRGSGRRRNEGPLMRRRRGVNCVVWVRQGWESF